MPSTKKSVPDKKESPSRLIDARIKELDDWRGETLSRIRTLIKEVDPEVVEEWKWRGMPVWYHDGMICTGETYKNLVKMTFAQGAYSRIRRGSSTPASRKRPSGHRFPRGREDKRESLEGADPRRDCLQHRKDPSLVRLHEAPLAPKGKPQMTFVPYDRPIRAAFVGLGRIYDLNVRAYVENPDVEVVALVDPIHSVVPNDKPSGPRRGLLPAQPSSRRAVWKWTRPRFCSPYHSTPKASPRCWATAGT